MEKQAENLYNVIRLIRPAFRHISKTVEIRSSQFDLSIGMRAALELINEHGPLTAPQLARLLSVERQYIQRSVNELLKEKLVERITNPQHKKSSLIALTTEGSKRFAALKEREMETLIPMSHKLTAEEITAAIKVMTTLSSDFAALNLKLNQDKEG